MFLQVNGARIFYERQGSGIPVVFLHEGVADHRMWDAQVEAFAQHFDVVRPDYRGFGQSDLPAVRWSPVADVLAIMDELQLKPAHIVGGSMGASLAIDFALDHPERVSRLVLLGPGVSGGNFGKKYPEIWADVKAADEANDMKAVNEAEMRLWLAGPARSIDSIDPRLRELFLDMNGTSLNSDWEAAPTKDLDPPAVGRLNEIKAPTLVIVGDSDVPPIMDAVDLLMRDVKGARKEVIRDAAHLANMEHPEEFNRLVLDFLLN